MSSKAEEHILSCWQQASGPLYEYLWPRTRATANEVREHLRLWMAAPGEAGTQEFQDCWQPMTDAERVAAIAAVFPDGQYYKMPRSPSDRPG